MGATVTLMLSMLGPVSSASPDGPGILVEGIAVLLCGWIVTDWIRQRKRQAALREMAGRRGFSYLGSSLPQGFTLRGSELEGATSIWNVVEGGHGGVRVVSFDCRIGSGKGSWRRTAIAAQAPPDILGMLQAGLTVDRCGDWSIAYEPNRLALIPAGLMSVSEVEAHFNAIGG